MSNVQRAIKRIESIIEDNDLDIVDIMTDARHYCVAHGVGFSDALHQSWNHYNTESIDEILSLHLEV